MTSKLSSNFKLIAPEEFKEEEKEYFD